MDWRLVLNKPLVNIQEPATFPARFPGDHITNEALRNSFTGIVFLSAAPGFTVVAHSYLNIDVYFYIDILLIYVIHCESYNVTLKL